MRREEVATEYAVRSHAHSQENPMPTPKPAIEEDWIPKAAAAKLLGVSPRQIERREQRGYIEKRQLPRRPTESTARVEYSRADVLALKAGTPNTYARAVEESEKSTSGPVSIRLNTSQPAESTALARVEPIGAPGREFERFAQLFATIQGAKPTPKPWLSLDEASAFSGLTRAWLLKEAESGEGSIAIRDMGKHARGGRWRFLRDDLGKGE
jgi:hypothetical protein